MTDRKASAAQLLYLVDAQGGALSVLAAGVAQALGWQAVALTSSAPTDVPAEVATVLDEVGMKAPTGAAAALATMDASAGKVVFLGASPPASLASTSALDVALYDGSAEGSGELERLAAARIARDRIERALTALRRSV